MTDMSLGIIYTIKTYGSNCKDPLIGFLSQYTDSPKTFYSDAILKWMIRDCFIDYIKTADNPSYAIRQFFELQDRIQDMQKVYEPFEVTFSKEIDAIIIVLAVAPVKNNNEYINGFRAFDIESFAK